MYWNWLWQMTWTIKPTFILTRPLSSLDFEDRGRFWPKSSWTCRANYCLSPSNNNVLRICYLIQSPCVYNANILELTKSRPPPCFRPDPYSIKRNLFTQQTNPVHISIIFFNNLRHRDLNLFPLLTGVMLNLS